MSRSPSPGQPDANALIERVYGHVAAAGSDATLARVKCEQVLAELADTLQHLAATGGSSLADTSRLVRDAQVSATFLHGLLIATCDQLAHAEVAAIALRERS